MTEYPLAFTVVIKEKVKDYGSSFIEFQNLVTPILRGTRPDEWGRFHGRNMTILIEGSDIQKRTDLYSQFGQFSFTDLKHLILKLEDLCKHIKWIKGHKTNSRWFFPCYTALVDLENEAVFLRKLLIDLNRSESRRLRKISSI